MTFPGRFREQLIDGQLDHVSLSFLVDDLHIYRGGVGGNIAVGLGRLGFSSYLVGAVGADFAEYREWLETHGVDAAHVYVSDTRHTARFLCTTDADDNQIASFYAGAMAEAGRIDLADVVRRIGTVDLVLVAPNDPQAMVRHTQACRELGVPFAADPSQQLARMDGSDIRQLVEGAQLLFTNEYERDLMEHKTKWTRDEILSRVGHWVTTFGAKGLEIRSADGTSVHVGAHQDLEAADPTGVGDACRAGFLAGLQSGLGARRSAEIGCTLASFVLESVGTQEYTFTAEDFASRVARTYGAESATDVRAFLAAHRRTDPEENA
ncbi:MAG TPA: carbohydrate kinase family protein [Mycobacteriales bacterium]|nr:carbohydrate kinase family protein [Mycobacteriales bacterium]